MTAQPKIIFAYSPFSQLLTFITDRHQLYCKGWVVLLYSHRQRLVGKDWQAKVFRTYDSAPQMFHVPVEKHGPNVHLRPNGKIVELAFGYDGSVSTLKAMGALEIDLSEEKLQPLMDMWRGNNPRITQF